LPTGIRRDAAVRRNIPGHGAFPKAAVVRPRYRLSLVEHQRSLTMFLLTRTGNPDRSVP
jgi:hypothetical protein